jgi:hypothetical protein
MQPTPNQHRNRCVRLLSTAGVLAGLLLAPAVAAASEPPPTAVDIEGRTVIGANMTIDGSDISKQTTVSCPDGSLALSGGVLYSTFLGDFLMSGSAPTATGDGWQVQIYNRGHRSGTLGLQVVCDFHVRDPRIVDGVPVSVAPGTYKQATATCADGRQAVSGGWRTDVPEVAGSQSLPTPTEPGTGWLNVVRNMGTGNATITTVAICARVDEYTQAFSEREGVKPGRGSWGSSAYCPGELRAYGGGYHTDTVNITAMQSAPNAGGGVPWTSWYAAVFSDDPQPRQFYRVVVCARREAS